MGSSHGEFSGEEFEIHSIEVEFEEVLPDGTRRRVTYTETSTFKRERGIRGSLPLKWLTIAAVLSLIIIIGLVTVGPEEVWRSLIDITDKLVD